MTIYLKKEHTEDIFNFIQQETVPAHEKIGALFTNTLLAQESDRPKLFQALGVHPLDRDAIAEMTRILTALKNCPYRIVSTENTGVYFIKKIRNDKIIAVYKVGHKRAEEEAAARRLAYETGLAEHAICGVVCAAANLYLCSSALQEIEFEDAGGYESSGENKEAGIAEIASSDDEDEDVYTFSGENKGVTIAGAESSDEEEESTSSAEASDDDEEMVEELWNGWEKTYRLPSAYVYQEETEETKPLCTVVGILQPFLPDTQKASVYEYTRMTMFALAIGLRDGKQDGYKGSKLFDLGDIMPTHIDPPIGSSQEVDNFTSAIDLPYLDEDDRTTMELNLNRIAKLAGIVQKWNIFKITDDLKHLKICYEDKVAETMALGAEGLDEGGCDVMITKSAPHLINGYLNHLTEENSKRRMFTVDQLNACNTRLQRIHDFVLSHHRDKISFTPQDLVHAVDQYGKNYHDALYISPTLSPDVRYIRDRQGSFHVTGRYSPHRANIRVSSEGSSSSGSSPTPPPSSLVMALEQSVEENLLEKST